MLYFGKRRAHTRRRLWAVVGSGGSSFEQFGTRITMGRNRRGRLPTVRYLDAKEDIYGFEMLRRLLLEIRKSSPLLRSLRNEIRKRPDDTELEWLGPWVERHGIRQRSGLGQALRETAEYWLRYPHQMEAGSPYPFIPPVFPSLEEITLAVGWDRTRETWEKFEVRVRRQSRAALNEFLKRYKAEVMQQTERVRRYETESIRWLVWKAWGFDERGRPWSWNTIAGKTQRSIPTVKRAVKCLSDFYGIKLERRSSGGRPPGRSSTLR